jgi:hypothetical protein
MPACACRMRLEVFNDVSREWFARGVGGRVVGVQTSEQTDVRANRAAKIPDG